MIKYIFGKDLLTKHIALLDQNTQICFYTLNCFHKDINFADETEKDNTISFLDILIKPGKTEKIERK